MGLADEHEGSFSFRGKIQNLKSRHLIDDITIDFLFYKKFAIMKDIVKLPIVPKV